MLIDDHEITMLSRKRKADDELLYTGSSRHGPPNSSLVVTEMSTSLSRLSLQAKVGTSGGAPQSEPSASAQHKRCRRESAFTIPPSCMVESEQLILEGESARDISPNPEEERSLPIRVLDKFVIFDEANDGSPASLSALEDSSTILRAYGMVKPLYVPDDQEYESDVEEAEEAEEGVEFISTVIFLYYLDCDPLEPMIWLKTEYSWLILDRPAPDYLSLYLGFWKPRYICRLGLLTTQEASRHFTLQIQDVAQTETGGAVSLLGEPFKKDHILQALLENDSALEDLLRDAEDGGWENADRALRELRILQHKSPERKTLPRRMAGRSSNAGNVPHIAMAPRTVHFHPFFTPEVATFASQLGLLGFPQHPLTSSLREDRPGDGAREALLLAGLRDSVADAIRGEQEGVWGLDSRPLQCALDQEKVPYHCLDFVYFRGRHSLMMGSEPFRIGQIRGFRSEGGAERIEVQAFERFDRLDGILDGSDATMKDSRHLYATREVLLVLPQDLRGRCVVVHHDVFNHTAEHARPQNDHFYVKYFCRKDERRRAPRKDEFVLLSRTDLNQCPDPSCRRRRKGGLKIPSKPLRCLELFHGAGGLSVGLEKAGTIVTKWAVDASPSTHATFKANFPHAKAILQDTNAVLRRAVALAQGRDAEPLYQMGKYEACPELPAPGDVDIIIGGPPCQGFSRLNSFASASDVRNSLVGNMLSYVDFLEPRFVLIENVEAMVNMSSTVEGKNGKKVTIEHAFAKLVVGFLVHRGYQVRFKVLQAAQYGAPQGRNRVIFLAARRGEILPEFPLPTHTWLSRTITRRDQDGGAPHPLVTVGDAISDLPPFHWDWTERGLRGADPDLPRSAEKRVRAITRNRTRAACGYLEPVAYGGPPKTAYQQMLRGTAKKVEHHVTPTASLIDVERVCNIPPPQPEIGRPEGMDWRDICPALAPPDAAHPHGAIVRDSGDANRDAKYARVYSTEPAQTVVTTMVPRGRMPRVLHYKQYRLLSARENARLQGFPDSFQFISPKGSIDDIYRLIGNAVPIPLVYQLGLEFSKALLKKEELDALAARGDREMSLEL